MVYRMYVCFHMFSNCCVSIRYEIFDTDLFVLQEIIETVLESFKFHCTTAGNLISLKRNTNIFWLIVQEVYFMHKWQFLYEKENSFSVFTYLYKREVNYLRSIVTINCVGAKFCTVAHTVMTCISRNCELWFLLQVCLSLLSDMPPSAFEE